MRIFDETGDGGRMILVLAETEMAMLREHLLGLKFRGKRALKWRRFRRQFLDAAADRCLQNQDIAGPCRKAPPPSPPSRMGPAPLL